MSAGRAAEPRTGRVEPLVLYGPSHAACCCQVRLRAPAPYGSARMRGEGSLPQAMASGSSGVGDAKCIQICIDDPRPCSQANAAYTRAAVRGATCHLRLGDFGAAAAMLRASESAAVGTAAAKELADKLAEVAQLQKDFSRVRLAMVCCHLLLLAARSSKGALGQFGSRLLESHVQGGMHLQQAGLAGRALLQALRQAARVAGGLHALQRQVWQRTGADHRSAARSFATRPAPQSGFDTTLTNIRVC